MKIEFKEIHLKESDIYDPSSYPSKGFYLVETDITVDKSMVYNNGLNIVWMAVLPEDYTPTKEASDEGASVNSSITQELFLKTLSLVVNKDESYK